MGALCQDGLADETGGRNITLTFELEQTRVEAGSNTSTVTLRVVGGDENGSLNSQTVKYGHKSHGTRTQERLHWRGPAEKTPHKNKTVTVK
jgi:hypothetical protein